ncbi:hypothetical protein VCHA48P439_230038 [Vibrio chagasii]|nr:hypothetical protein VCHA34P117_240037 [Vibrio chagasii]CAH7072767.1 hypothetical protein VCHA48P439_230038 [Vibrio chagasii]CAH7319788.1 hypothetical protein VCHA53O462_230037 [Vibrio chagasii]
MQTRITSFMPPQFEAPFTMSLISLAISVCSFRTKLYRCAEIRMRCVWGNEGLFYRSHRPCPS